MSNAAQTQRTTVTGQVAERIEAMILDGTLDPGASLPSEVELARTLAVSRLTVREATRALAARGLLHIHQGRRPTVAAPSAALVGDFFQTSLRRDPEALLDLLDVRFALEVHAASLAATRASKTAIAAMRGAIAAMRAAADDPEAFHDADVTFHESLAAGTGNQLLSLIIEALAEPLRASRIQSFEGHLARGLGVASVIEAHAAIFDRVEARDAKGAAKAMRAHLRQTEQDLRTLRLRRR